MMKAKDCSVATALVINGYLRANEATTLSDSDANDHLADCLNAIRQEVSDWAENLGVPEGEDASALEPTVLNVDAVPTGSGVLNRTPYNLVSVAIAALREAVDLAGPEMVMADFHRRASLPSRSVHIDDLHKSEHPIAKANAASWKTENGGPVNVRRGK